MITEREFEFIHDRVTEVLGVKKTNNIKIAEEMGVFAAKNEDGIYVGGEDKAYTARALMLLYNELEKGATGFEIRQKRHLENCGVMLDMSRNGVMRVEYVKKYIDVMAALGLNLLMLYTEDTYELKNYPLFGYRRGRYTAEELKSIDDYAFSLGVEVVPCIQTLGHMNQYLKWDKSQPVRDTWSCLFCGEEATYKMIEEMIATLSGIFRSRRIHIGMDEAFDMGLCGYLMKHGYQDRFKIFTDHLNRVVQICKKYNTEPMIWADMFFRIASKIGDYHDFSAVVPEDVINSIPDVELVLWSYGNNDDEFHRKAIKRHVELGKKVMFAGGIPIWLRMQPEYRTVFEGMTSALKECMRQGVDEFIATVWGDDSTETDPFYSIAALPVLSEHFYRGEECDTDSIKEIMKLVTGFEYEHCLAMSDYQSDPKDPSLAKAIYYSDILYNFTNKLSFGEVRETYENSLKVLKECKPDKRVKEYYEHSIRVFEISLMKIDIFEKIRPAYESSDMQTLKRIAFEQLPRLYEMYSVTGSEHMKKWREENKVFGGEVMQSRYATILDRIKYAMETLEGYIKGDIGTIEELEYDYIDDRSIIYTGKYAGLVSTSVIF